MRESREHVHNSCRNIALVTQACATLSQHSVFDDGSSQLPHSTVVVKAVWWNMNMGSYLCILEGGKSEICVFRSMACRRDIVPHSGIIPVSICKVIQMLVAFVMVETAFQQDWILFHRVHHCYMFRHRYYFQVFINTKKKNEKGYCNIILMFVYFINVLKHVNYYKLL